MRTRSGSLAAVMARVPSHPAHSGMLCICTANASSQSGLRTEDIPGSTRQKDSRHCTFRRPAGVANTGLGWRALFSASAARATILALALAALVLNRPTGMLTRLLALLPYCSIILACETQAVGAAALLHNDGPRSRTARIIQRCRRRLCAQQQRRTDSVTMLLAIPRSLEISMPLRTPPLVISRLRIMTRLQTAMPTTTWQLALRRS